MAAHIRVFVGQPINAIKDANDQLEPAGDLILRAMNETLALSGTKGGSVELAGKKHLNATNRRSASTILDYRLFAM